MFHATKRLALACTLSALLAPGAAAAADADFAALLAGRQELAFHFCAGQGASLEAHCAEPDGESTLVCRAGGCVESAADETRTYAWSRKDGGIELASASTVDVDYQGRTIVAHAGDLQGLYMNDDKDLSFPSDFARLFEQAPQISWYACNGGGDGTGCSSLNRSRSYTFAKDGTGKVADDGDRLSPFTWKPRPGGVQASFVHRMQFSFDGRHLVLQGDPDGTRVAYVLVQTGRP